MKKLVIYYSFDGNTELIAKEIARETGADLLKLTPKKEISTHGFMKYFWGGKQASMKEKPELMPFSKNPQDYDVLIIGTPVWAFRYSPPLYTFFSSISFSGKKIALFCCHGGGKAKTLEKMKEQLHGNEIIGEIDFQEPLKHDAEAEQKRAREWAQTIMGKI